MQKIPKAVLNFFLSLKTTIVLLLALLLFMLYGSFIMPQREEFQLLNAVPLFRWVLDNPADITWWLWAAVAVLSLLTANTIICSIESTFKKRESRHLSLTISPQVIHIGFLFILLAHLLSSSGGFKGTAYVTRGTEIPLPNGMTAVFDAVNANADPNGYIQNWSADVTYYIQGKEIAKDRIEPNSPSFQKGLGIYIKTVQFSPYPVALIEVSREPGAIWALIGGILFLLGTMMLIVLKVRRGDV